MKAALALLFAAFAVAACGGRIEAEPGASTRTTTTASRSASGTSAGASSRGPTVTVTSSVVTSTTARTSPAPVDCGGGPSCIVEAGTPCAAGYIYCPRSDFSSGLYGTCLYCIPSPCSSTQCF